MWNPAIIAAPIVVPVLEDIMDAELAEPVPTVTGWLPGYHVNLPADLMTAEFEAYAVYPALPAQVFMGVPTAFLRFVDEEEARAVLSAFWLD